jgi:hypothetical protein
LELLAAMQVLHVLGGLLLILAIAGAIYALGAAALARRLAAKGPASEAPGPR